MAIHNLPICSRSELHSFIKNDLLPKWQRGESTLLRIEPERVDSRTEATVKTAITNNRKYKKGEKIVLNSRAR